MAGFGARIWRRRLASVDSRLGRSTRIGSFVLIGMLIALSVPSFPHSPVPVPVRAYSHDPITIEGDAEFDSAHGVVAGAGTHEDPYIISGWYVLAQDSWGIEIGYTTAHYVIEDCTVDGDHQDIGVFLNNAPNGVVRNTTVHDKGVGITSYRSYDVVIKDCNVSENLECGVNLIDPLRNIVDNCSANGSSNGIALSGVVNDVLISDCNLTENQLAGIRVDGPNDNVTVRGNNISSSSYNMESGIRIGNVTIDSKFIGNTVDILVGSGIEVLGDFVRSSIANNNITRCGWEGISVAAPHLCQIVDNGVRNGGYGIVIGDDDYERPVLVARNTVSQCWRDGIWSMSPNTTIDSNSVDRCGHEAGIKIWAPYNTVLNNIISNCSYYGLLLDDAVWGCSISHNTFVNDGVHEYYFETGRNTYDSNTVNGRPLLFLENVTGQTVISAGQIIAVNCSGLLVKDMNLSYSSAGIELYGCSWCTIENVTIWGDQLCIYMSGYKLGGSGNNTIRDCVFGNSRYCISLEFWCNDTLVENNTIANCTIGLYSIVGSNNAQILGNEFMGVGNPVQLDTGTANATVAGNIMADCMTGILLDNARDCCVSQNCITNATNYGIRLLGRADYNTVTNNTVSRGTVGIDLYTWRGTPPNNNAVTWNLVTDQTDSGIRLTYAFSNTIAWNHITRNAVGVNLIGSGLGGNYIFLNVFDNNVHNALCSWSGEVNYWNTSEPVEYEYMGVTYTGYLGNYWDDYSGVDSDGNGVGDSSYAVGDEFDNYPLISAPSEIPEYDLLPVLVATMACMLAPMIIVRRKRQSTS